MCRRSCTRSAGRPIWPTPVCRRRRARRRGPRVDLRHLVVTLIAKEFGAERLVPGVGSGGAGVSSRTSTAMAFVAEAGATATSHRTAVVACFCSCQQCTSHAANPTFRGRARSDPSDAHAVETSATEAIDRAGPGNRCRRIGARINPSVTGVMRWPLLAPREGSRKSAVFTGRCPARVVVGNWAVPRGFRHVQPYLRAMDPAYQILYNWHGSI